MCCLELSKTVLKIVYYDCVFLGSELGMGGVLQWVGVVGSYAEKKVRFNI